MKFLNKKNIFKNKYLYLLFLLFIIYICYYFYKKNVTNYEFFNNYETKFEVIHMSGNNERLENIQSQEKKGQIKIDLFEATNGKKLNIPKLQEEGFIKKPWDTHRYNNAKNKEKKDKIMKGEIGCYMSHLNLLQKIGNSDYDGWTIIFEDDLILKDNFKDELDKILKNLENNDTVDMVYLGNTHQHKCNKGIYKDNLCYPDTPYGTQAYMVNKRSAQKIYDLIKYIDDPIDVKYDLLMKDNKINGLVVIPSLVIQNNENESMII